MATTMLPTLRRRLEALAERREELERLLVEPGLAADPVRFRALSREFSQLEPLSAALADERRAQADLDTARAMREDPELRALAEDEITAAQARLAGLDDALVALLDSPEARDEQVEAMALTMQRLGKGGEPPGLRAARSVIAAVAGGAGRGLLTPQR